MDNVIYNGTLMTNVSDEIVEVEGKVIPKIARFEKVSFEQFKKDMISKFDDYAEKENLLEEIYSKIKLPQRATRDSAGYDFYAPFAFIIPKYSSDNTDGIVIPTGIRCTMDTGWVLVLVPRSGLGFKYGVFLFNTNGIIDGDYAYADNEGHIMVKLGSRKGYQLIEQDFAFCQGIFLPYGITYNDNATEIRTGGFGSTNKK